MQNDNIIILFIGYGMLGDHIVCFRSLELLKEKYPQSRIFFVGNPNFAETGVKFGNNIIDQILDIEDDELKNYYTKQNYSSLFWDSVFNEANIVINHKMDTNNYFLENLISKGFQWVRTQKSAKKFELNNKILLQDNVKDESRNAYAQVGELVELLGIYTNKWQTTLNVSSNIKDSATREIDKYFNTNINSLIAFHPGSSSQEKNYPIEKWAIIINELISKQIGLKVLIFIGSDEQYLLPEIEKLFLKEQFKIVNKPLIEAIGFLSLCKLFLGHDTGFAHISASLKLPSVLIFGKFSSEIWKPPASWVNIIQLKNFTENVSIKEFKKAIDITIYD